MKSRVFRLLSQHQALDEAVRREQRLRAPDPLNLQRLKKRKLAVKDQLHAGHGAEHGQGLSRR